MNIDWAHFTPFVSLTGGIILGRAGAKSAMLFRFPMRAADALAGLDPREAVAVEFLFAGSTGDQVRRAYNKAGYLKGRREMMQWWSNHIQAAAQGNVSLAVVPEYKPAA